MWHQWLKGRWASVLLSLSCLIPVTASAVDSITLEPVEVTTSKLPIALRDVPATVTVVDGNELRALGARDLRTALSQVAGVAIAPGGDAGPASAVPSLWGLREFDAFLLVVDDVPSGGAFTPALASLDLANVERIEVLKGAAPVSYGATSFVGVIHVIHYAAGAGPTRATLGVGSRGSIDVALAMPLSNPATAWRQSLLVDGAKQPLSGARSGFDRRHLLYRGAADVGAGEFTLDLDLAALRQQPGSPQPIEDGTFSSRVPLDANDNPRGARSDEDRTQLGLGYELPTALGQWSSRVAITRTDDTNLRGYLRPDFSVDGVTVNADGFQQVVRKTDVYLDSHMATALSPQASLVWGFDSLYGRGSEHSANFEYAVLPDGSNAPDWRSLHVDEFTHVGDRRNFSGLYVELNDALTDRWHVQAGVRFNHTQEGRYASHIDNSGPVPLPDESSSQRQTDSHWSGTVGTSYRLWQADSDFLTAYANHRIAFKPAVIDFGPEAEGGILQPETADSSELGLKARQLNGLLSWNVALFDMRFRNLVVAQAVDGLPGQTNAGTEHFKGAELDLRLKLSDVLAAMATYAWHDARYGNYLQLVDTTPVQVRGKLLALSPQQLASAGITYTPRRGLAAHLLANFNGACYLDGLNTIHASAYTTIDAGLSFRHAAWEWRLDGYNLTNRRDAVAASELGIGQMYRMTARSVLLSVSRDFDLR